MITSFIKIVGNKKQQIIFQPPKTKTLKFIYRNSNKLVSSETIQLNLPTIIFFEDEYCSDMDAFEGFYAAAVNHNPFLEKYVEQPLFYNLPFPHCGANGRICNGEAENYHLINKIKQFWTTPFSFCEMDPNIRELEYNKRWGTYGKDVKDFHANLLGFLKNWNNMKFEEQFSMSFKIEENLQGYITKGLKEYGYQNI